LKVRKDKAGGNINKEGACSVAMLGAMTTHGIRQTWTSGDHLVDTAHVARLKGTLSNWLRIMNGMPFDFAILTFTT